MTALEDEVKQVSLESGISTDLIRHNLLRLGVTDKKGVTYIKLDDGFCKGDFKIAKERIVHAAAGLTLATGDEKQACKYNSELILLGWKTFEEYTLKK